MDRGFGVIHGRLQVQHLHVRGELGKSFICLPPGHHRLAVSAADMPFPGFQLSVSERYAGVLFECVCSAVEERDFLVKMCEETC